MRRGGAKSCKNGLGRDNEKYFGRRITTNFMVRLGRRNKELNEFLWRRGTGAKHCSSLCSQSEGDGYVANLSEIYCGLCGSAAPERGSYSRIGARPYLSPQLIISRCCPCKGRISWAGLAPQQDSRYEPLTGARFINRIQKGWGKPLPWNMCPLQGRWRRIVRNMVQAGALAPYCFIVGMSIPYIFFIYINIV